MIHKRSTALEQLVKYILLECLNRFLGAPTSPPLVQMAIKTQTQNMNNTNDIQNTYTPNFMRSNHFSQKLIKYI